MRVIQPKTDIQAACLEGVQNAYTKYFAWSGEYSLRYAPESFIQAEIANTLNAVCGYVTLEDTVRSVLREAGANLRGKLPRNATGRFDIISWWANGTPRKIIEVKKAFTENSINADAKRLRQVLGRGGSTRKGMIVVYTSAINVGTISKRLRALEKASCTKLVCNLGPQESRDSEGNLWHWDAACYMVSADT